MVRPAAPAVEVGAVRPDRVDGLTARARGDADGGFALIMSILLILVVGGLSLAALALVVQQTKPTQVVRKNTETINGANAGLQAALTLLRNANVPDSSVGVLAKLPCLVDPTKPDAGTPVVGTLQDTTARNGYTTYIRYYASNPTGQPGAWLRDNRLPCPLTSVPAYALLENDGTSTSQPRNQANRAFTATYKFTITNQKPVGGRMMAGGKCWDVGSAPDVGTKITYQTCLAVGSPSQQFSYRKDLSLAWTSGATTLCLDYRGFWSSAVPALPGPPTDVTLQNCASPSGQFGSGYDPSTKTYTPVEARTQQFGSSDNWFAVEPDADGRQGRDRSGDNTRTAYGFRKSCVGARNSTNIDSVVTMTANSGCNTISTDTTVGAGGAGGTETGLPGPSKQLVNFAVGGRCVDVNGSKVGWANSKLITWYCHQAPDPSKIEGNQKFTFTGEVGQPGHVIARRTDLGASSTEVNTGVDDYDASCLMADPASNRTPLVLLTEVHLYGGCQNWTFAGVVPGDYAASYTIKHADGRCLEATGTNPGSNVVLAACTGAEKQKWNAPPNLTKASITGIAETTALRTPTP